MRSPEPEAAALGLGETGGAQRFSHEAMATVFEVRAAHPDPAYAAQAAHAAFALLDRLEQELSRFVANSDVSRINELQAGSATRVSPDTMDCLVIARHMFDLTSGAFDVALGSGLQRLELDPDALAVHARQGGARLDLGGIGKGFAVDRMAELLEEWGLERALVHGGWSSVLALEPPSQRGGWPLRLRAPGPEGSVTIAAIEARQQALSASGTRKGDHILDPHTGRPAAPGATFALLPRERQPGHLPATVAEALSTAFMLLPVVRIESLCRENPGLEVWRLDSGSGQNTQALHLGTAPPGRARPGTA